MPTARAALAIEDRPTMERVTAALRPAVAELAAGSGVITVGPVAGHLADLAAALGRDEEAAEHRRTGSRAHRACPRRRPDLSAVGRMLPDARAGTSLNR